MFRPGTHRRLIALVAAYGLALQALLSVVVAVSPAAEFGAIICSAGAHPGGGAADDQLPPSPGHRIGCPVCALGCAGAAPPVGSDAASVILWFTSSKVAREWPAVAPGARLFARVGLARAPPA
jgi:hypothetical protein